MDTLVSSRFCKKGNEPQLAWINRGWSRTANAPLPPFVPHCPRVAPPRTLTWYEPCDQQTLERWKKDSFKFPLYQYLRRNGLTNSETWRCLDADERERLLGCRPDHTMPAMSTSAKTWELEIASIGSCGAHGCARVFVLGLIPQPPSAIGSSACSHTCQSCPTESRWDQRESRNRHHQRNISTT